MWPEEAVCAKALWHSVLGACEAQRGLGARGGPGHEMGLGCGSGSSRGIMGLE